MANFTKTDKGCAKHEEILCTQHPDRVPYCYRCQHYHPSYERDFREYITYYVTSGHDKHTTAQFKKFEPNKCQLSGCKLYNNTRLSNELQEALHISGYKPMPTPRSGGCKYFIVKSQQK